MAHKTIALTTELRERMLRIWTYKIAPRDSLLADEEKRNRRTVPHRAKVWDKTTAGWMGCRCLAAAKNRKTVVRETWRGEHASNLMLQMAKLQPQLP